MSQRFGSVDLLLVPRPQRLEWRGHGAPIDAPVSSRQRDGLPAEGFQLEITAGGVELGHSDDNGLRYGLALFEQIRQQSVGELPGLFVDDWPDFPVRGYLLDVSRDRVPTRDTLARLVELLALARLNQFQLYTEHAFAYSDHETVWREASPITSDDVLWLDELCRRHGIELVPNQNTFGHMERWLEHDAYRHRAESTDGFEVLGIRRPPGVLAPTKDNAGFVLGLLEELLPNFSSRRVNVNGDEPFELGLGVSRDEVKRRGKETVYLDYMLQVVEPLLGQGREVQIWADILRRDPSVARQLPDGVVPVAWTYEAPGSPGDAVSQPRSAKAQAALEELGLDPSAHQGFATNTAPLVDAGVPFWVAAGTSGWRSFVGRVDNARANLLDAAEVGIAHGVGGYLVTDWGDAGHWNPPSVTFGPIVFGGAVSWALDANRDLDLPAVLDRYVFADEARVLGGVLETLGHAWRRTGMWSNNCSPLVDGLRGKGLFVGGQPDPAQLSDLIVDLDESIAAIDGASPASSDSGAVRHELVTASRLARHGAWRLLALVDGPTPSKDALTADREEILRLQEEAWRARSRPGGLSDSLAGLRRLLEGSG